MARIGIAALLLVALLLNGCSTTFTYNRLDWLIPWYVDGYVDLTREQRRMLRENLEPTLQWHREEELARYLEILEGIEADLAGPVTAEQVRRWVEEIIAAAERIEQSMMTVALDFGAKVSDEQMQEFIDSLREQQSEYEEEFLTRSDEEYRQDNLENLADYLDGFLGPLSQDQVTILRDVAASLQRFDSTWLEEREAWLDKLEPLLQRESGWQEAVRQAYSKREEDRTPEYRAILEHNMAVATLGVADVLDLASEKQRERALKEIKDWKRKIRKLIGDRRSDAAAFKNLPTLGLQYGLALHEPMGWNHQ